MSTSDELELFNAVDAALSKRWPEANIDPTLDRIAEIGRAHV